MVQVTFAIRMPPAKYIDKKVEDRWITYGTRCLEIQAPAIAERRSLQAAHNGPSFLRRSVKPTKSKVGF